MHEDRNPLVSVLMTAYNREKYIAEAIESVLASSYKNFELIVVDDASTDATVSIAKQYKKQDSRIQVHANTTNMTQWPTRNIAAGLAKGEYIKYLDSDDTIYEWGLAYCVEMMEKYPQAPMGILLNNPGIKKEIISPEEAMSINFFERPFLNVGPSGTILRRDLFERTGYYNTSYGVPSDMYFNIKMAGSYPLVLMSKEFFFYRVHESQEYNNKYSYLYNNYRYLNDVLNLPGFPLTPQQKKALTTRSKKSFVMEFLVYVKNTRQFSKAWQAYRHSGIGVGGVVRGTIENIKERLGIHKSTQAR